ncbi:MAG: GntR family transcriptional regulator [Pseudomonadales bacterium]|nr:GntR family transcriptional regulator [Pseudomonadales bacterium]
MRFEAPESLSEQIAQHLGKKIITGNLKPRERVQELRIAAELNVSRGSVREALLILERRHLVKIYPRKGAVVSELSIPLANALYDMYINLLAMLVRQVTERWQDQELAPFQRQLRQINQLADQSEIDFDGLIEAGFGLMNLCFPIVKNPFLQETLENLKPALSRTYFIVLSLRRHELKQTLTFYSDVVAAVRERNQAKVSHIIKAYGEHQRSLVLSVLGELAEAAALVS